MEEVSQITVAGVVGLFAAVRFLRWAWGKKNGGTDTERVVKAIRDEGTKTRASMCANCANQALALDRAFADMREAFAGLDGYLRGRSNRDR
tara:strand:- start:2399 stop:2671 length:273 start_codon:yes stop_codon:yes gene_type:complete